MTVKELKELLNQYDENLTVIHGLGAFFSEEITKIKVQSFIQGDNNPKECLKLIGKDSETHWYR